MLFAVIAAAHQLASIFMLVNVMECLKTKLLLCDMRIFCNLCYVRSWITHIWLYANFICFSLLLFFATPLSYNLNYLGWTVSHWCLVSHILKFSLSQSSKLYLNYDWKNFVADLTVNPLERWKIIYYWNVYLLFNTMFGIILQGDLLIISNIEICDNCSVVFYISFLNCLVNFVSEFYCWL